jgi:hypothetical protein
VSGGRFLCIDVGDADEALSAQAVTRAIAMSSSWDRLVCFGRAAVVAARLERQERAERDGMWLEVSAQWLLATDATTGSPARPAPGPLALKATAIGRPGLDAGALPVAERLIDLVGTLLVMAVPSAKYIDDVDNAHLWLVGGAPSPHVDDGQGRIGGRAVVGVGGGIVGVAIVGHEATVTSWTLTGEAGASSTVRLGGASRMSVRSAHT